VQAAPPRPHAAAEGLSQTPLAEQQPPQVVGPQGEPQPRAESAKPTSTTARDRVTMDCRLAWLAKGLNPPPSPAAGSLLA
jgi:hypothetical protein